MRLILSLIPVAVLASSLSRAAFAHAEMMNAVPRVGSTVTAAPTEIAIDSSRVLSQSSARSKCKTLPEPVWIRVSAYCGRQR